MSSSESTTSPFSCKTLGLLSGKSINKNLLTPCRQIGLSRKRKSCNFFKSSAPDALEGVSKLLGLENADDKLLTSEANLATFNEKSCDLSAEDTNSSETVFPSPKVKRKFASKHTNKKSFVLPPSENVAICLENEFSDKSVENENCEIWPVQEKLNIKKTILGCINGETASMKYDSVDKSDLKTLQKHDKPNKLPKLRNSQKVKTVSVCNKTSKLLSNEPQEELHEEKTSVKLPEADDILNSNSDKECSINTKSSLNESCEELFRVEKDMPKLIPYETLPDTMPNYFELHRSEKRIKTWRRTLSMKISDEEISDSETQKCITSQSPNHQLRPCSVKLTKLGLELAVNDYKPNPDEVRALEQQVKQKRKLLDDLKQAEICKKLHNVENLQQLTAVWKDGCICALNDLLPHLRQHADIDMPTLYYNLQVPSNLISLSSAGELQ